MKDGKIELLEQLFMAAHVMDNDGVILWANAFGMNQLGYIAEDFLGHSFSEFLAQNQDSVMDAIVLQSLSGPDISIPISLFQKSGELKHFQMNCEIKSQSLYVDKVTERKAVAKRRKSERAFTDYVDIHKKNEVSRCGSVTAAEYARSDLQRSQSSRKPYATYPLEAIFRKNEFTEEYTQILCYLRDDVEKYKSIAEEKCLSKTSLFQDAFIRRVFHKMRTPLHVICNSLGISEVTLEELSEVRYHAEVLLGVVEDLAFATMFETGKLTPLNLKPIHIASMLSEVLEAAYATDERESTKNLLRLSIRCSTKVPPVVCADSSLQRILFNLVSNAVQFCSEGGEVSLAVHHSYFKPSSNGVPQLHPADKISVVQRGQAGREEDLPQEPESPSNLSESDSMNEVMAAAAVILENPESNPKSHVPPLPRPPNTTTTTTTKTEHNTKSNTAHTTVNTTSNVTGGNGNHSSTSSCSSFSTGTVGTVIVKKDRESGYFTFIISNSTAQKIDVETVKRSFLRTQSFGGCHSEEQHHTSASASRKGSCSGVDKDIHLAEGGMHCAPALPPLRSSKYDQKLRANSKSELPQRRKDRDTDDSRDDCQLKLNSLSTDLTSCRGIGIGLQTAYNMVQVMGGQLDCSATDAQTVFWFTVHLEVAATGEFQYRSWSHRPSPIESKRNSPYDSKKNSPFQSRRNSPFTSQKNSPFVSRKTSPQDSKCGTAPGTPGFSPAPSPLSSALSSPRDGQAGGVLSSDNLVGGRYPGQLENLYPFRAASCDESSLSSAANTKIMAKALKLRHNIGAVKYAALSRDTERLGLGEDEEVNHNGFNSSVSNSLKLEIPFLSLMTDPSPTPVRHASCCEFDDVFKEMISKKEICDRHNEGTYVPDGNMSTLKKILIVDDSVLCRKIIIKVLDGANYSFETAGNGKEACEKMAEKPLRFDAVLMDLRMPVMDGIEATRYIRDVLLLELPIIALTAEIGIDARSAVLNAGANSLISKPAQAEDIIRVLDELIYLEI